MTGAGARRKTRILCLIGQLGNGGSERQLYLFIKNLDRSLHDVFVVVSNDSTPLWRARYEDELGATVHSLADRPGILKLAAFRKLVHTLMPDVIYSWSFFMNAFRAAAGGRPFIGSLRGGLAEEREELNFPLFLLCLRCARMVVNSSRLAEELRQARLPKRRIHVVPNLFESFFMNSDADFREKTRADIRQSIGVPRDAVVVAGSGRASKGKDFPFWVEVFSRAASLCRADLRGYLMGDGGEAVRSLVEAKDMSSRVSIVGNIPEGRVMLPVADIFFLSSYLEGLPNVLLEAMDARCAAFSTDCAGVDEALGDASCRAGVVVRHGDVETAAKSLAEFADDPARRARLAEAAAARLPLFDASSVMPSHLAVINSALKPKTRAQLLGFEGGT